MTVCVVGLGHVGLPTALLAAQDDDVVGVDVDEDRVAAVDRGDLGTEEPGLEALYERVSDRVETRTDVVPADVYVVATPTPLDRETDVADLEHVRAAADAIADVLRPDDLVVLSSTVPPGTTERLVGPLLERSGLDVGEFHLSHCPERAIPGDSLSEMVHNDRLVGGVDEESRRRTRAFYRTFVEGDLHLTTPSVAEYVKLMENTYRDVNIALANEFAKIAEELGLDVHEARELANQHPRVDVHRPGPGVGGHCITIDPQFLAQSATNDRLISQARQVNDSMAKHVVATVSACLDRAEASRVTVFGVAYKGDVGDTRETPARPVLKLLRSVGYDVGVYDPHVDSFEVDPEPLAEALDGSDCIVVVTDHSEFASMDPGEVAPRMDGHTVVDARAVLDRPRWEEAGFDVRVLGDGS